MTRALNAVARDLGVTPDELRAAIREAAIAAPFLLAGLVWWMASWPPVVRA